MNGDGTFSWAKKPAVPDNRKRATIESRLPSRLCEKCVLQGIVSPIHLFQLNEEEALLMCKNADCTFMSSSNWETLVVKRSFSRIPQPSSKKSSSASSQLSTKSDGDKDKKTPKSGPWSSCSIPAFTPSSSSAKIQILPQQSALNSTVSQNSAQRYLVSPACPQDLSLKGKERKTLVPIAPFLTGHAHSFSSFQTNKIEHTFQQRGVCVQPSAASIPSSNPVQPKRSLVFSKKITGTDICARPPVGSKRRACSLDSDSLSSGGSSVGSRPTTPVSETVPNGKRIKRIVLPPETLSKLLAGTWKLEIRKSNKTETGAVFTSVKKDNSTNSCSNYSEGESSAYGRVKVTEGISENSVTVSKTDFSVSDIPSSKTVSSFPGSCNLEITAIGALHDIVKTGESGISLSSLTDSSDSVQSHIEAINFQLKSDSIKSHIETINLHINAINSAVGRSDLCSPLDFSHLCQKLGTKDTNEPSVSEGCEEERWMSPADLRSDPDNSDTNSSQSTCSTSFIPVGLCETPITESEEIPSNLHCEGLGRSSSTSQFFEDTGFKVHLMEV